MTYNLIDPTDVIFNAVDDLREVVEFSGNPYSPEQMVDLGYIIVPKNVLFRSDLRRLISKPLVDQKWPNFFRKLHSKLHKMSTSTEELSYQSVNSIV